MAAVSLDASGTGAAGNPTGDPQTITGISGNVAANAIIILAVGGDSDAGYSTTISGSGWSRLVQQNSGGAGYIFFYNGSGTGANPSTNPAFRHDRMAWAWASYSNVDSYSYTTTADSGDNAVDANSHTAASVVRGTLDRWVNAIGYRNITATEESGWAMDAQSENGWGRQALVSSRDGLGSNFMDPASLADSGTSPYLAAAVFALYSADGSPRRTSGVAYRPSAGALVRM